MDQEMALMPIGRVVSDVKTTRDMPVNGVPASIEVFPEFAPAVEDLETSTHVLVFGWMGNADRSVLQVVGRHPLPGGRPRGVFSSRSPSRPNPLGLTTTRLLAREGNILRLERLDMIDGTPVVDLKRYSRAWDCVFSARNSRDRLLPEQWDRAEWMEDMLLEAGNFHGETCTGAALGVRMLAEVAERWRVSPKDPDLRVVVGKDGCVTDAIQGVACMTLGSGRVELGRGEGYRFRHRGREIEVRLKPGAPRQVAAVLAAPRETLFRVQEGPSVSLARL